MAVLKVVCDRHSRVEREVEVVDVTSMHYAAIHVAEALGYQVGEQRFYLFDESGGGIAADDVAANWDGCKVLLGAASL